VVPNHIGFLQRLSVRCNDVGALAGHRAVRQRGSDRRLGSEQRCLTDEPSATTDIRHHRY
jgi:hypothetical protein